jgi:hypothetical protein
LEEIDEELVLIETPVFNPLKITINTTWASCKKGGEDLIFVDKASF